jgi:dienelactone hydrolase
VNPVCARAGSALLGGLCLLLAADALAMPADATLREAVQYARQQDPAPRLARAAFLARELERGLTLAPDGRHLAWLAAQGERQGVWLQAVPEGRPRAVLADTDATALDWSPDGRWLLVAGSRQLALIAVDGQPGSGELSALGGNSRRVYVGPDPVVAGAALVIERPARLAGDAKLWRLLRVQADARETELHADTRPIVDAALGPEGRVAWVLRAEDAQHLLYPLPAPGLDQPVLRCGALRRCRILGPSPQGGLWLSGNPDRDRQSLLHLDADGRLELQHEDPRAEADLYAVTLDRTHGQPRFLAYQSTVPQLHAVQPADRDRLERIQRRLEGTSLSVETGAGRWLLSERSDRWRGARHWLAEPDGSLQRVLADSRFEFAGQTQAPPADSAMARQWPVAWTATDGRRLHGFLSLPPGVDVRSAPLVVIVHGGPYSLVRPGFSPDAQFLANRGHVVFQPNFRGSTGLGLDYMRAAGGDFGRGRVLTDIVEGTRWLLAEGIGDPARVAIAGASFGGYAALLGVSHEPELFQAAVAGVPPVDFGWVVREYEGSGHEMYPGIPMSSTMRALGVDPADAALMQTLATQSPMANATSLSSPVLIVAAGQDERVPIRGITHYAAQLRTLGRDVSLFVDRDADHSLSDDLSREAYYYLMEAMLHARLGSPAPEPPSPALAAHLRKHLLLGSFREP